MEELWRIGERQLGLASRAQALLVLGRRGLEHQVARGRLIPVRRGVYRVAGSPPSSWEPAMAACLAAGPDAVVGFISAAALWGMGGLVLDRTEIVLPAPRRVRLPGVICHRSTLLPVMHRALRHGVSVTSPARTLFDMSATFISRQFLRKIIRESIRRGLVTPGQIRDCVDLLAARGRRRLTVIRAEVDRLGVDFHPGDSDDELDLLDVIVSAGLLRPTQQIQVVANGHVYLIDVGYLDIRLGIEYLGGQHGEPEAIEYDNERDAALRALGWTMLYVDKTTTPAGAVRAVRSERTRLLGTLPPPDVAKRPEVDREGRSGRGRLAG